MGAGISSGNCLYLMGWWTTGDNFFGEGGELCHNFARRMNGE
jgi:hypothetical protein